MRTVCVLLCVAVLLACVWGSPVPESLCSRMEGLEARRFCEDIVASNLEAWEAFLSARAEPLSGFRAQPKRTDVDHVFLRFGRRR